MSCLVHDFCPRNRVCIKCGLSKRDYEYLMYCYRNNLQPKINYVERKKVNTEIDWKNMWNNIKVLESTDKNVHKYVFEKPGTIVESVLYKYPTYEDRTVICCSTQCGCNVGCRFCGTGEYFVRSLTDEEIVSQPVKCIEDTGVKASDMKRLQIMFMSMGEPLLNKTAVISAIKKLHKLYPHAALLLSTSGPDVDYEPIFKVSEEVPTVGLQFSIHESTDDKRNELIPFKKKLNLWQITQRGEEFFKRTGRTPFFNYCVHPNNSSVEDARRLYYLFNPAIWQATISVICERDETISVAHERQRDIAEQFEKHLQYYGYRTRVFDPNGQDDIGAGCGQLIFIQRWMKEHPELAKKTQGYGLPVIHTPT